MQKFSHKKEKINGHRNQLYHIPSLRKMLVDCAAIPLILARQNILIECLPCFADEVT